MGCSPWGWCCMPMPCAVWRMYLTLKSEPLYWSRHVMSMIWSLTSLLLLLTYFLPRLISSPSPTYPIPLCDPNPTIGFVTFMLVLRYLQLLLMHRYFKNISSRNWIFCPTLLPNLIICHPVRGCRVGPGPLVIETTLGQIIRPLVKWGKSSDPL